MKKKKIAITGSSGFIGRNLIKYAIDQQHSIKALIRNKSSVSEHPNIEYIIGDLQDRNALNELVENTDAVIHLAGIVNSHNVNLFKAINVIGTQNLLNAISKNHVSRLVHISSLAAREKDISAYGLSKYESETIVENSNTTWTIIRPPAVYGPHDQDHLLFFKMAERRIMLAPLKGQASFMSVDHLCQFILNTIDHSGTHYQLYEVDSGPSHRIDHKSLALLLSDIVGHKVFRIPLPETLMMIGSFFDRIIHRGDARLTMDRVNYLGHPDWVISQLNPPPEDLLDLSDENFHRGFTNLYNWYRDNNKI